MRKIFIIVITVVMSLLGGVSNKEVQIEKHYYECYRFKNATDSSFFAYKLDCEVDELQTGTHRVYSFMCDRDGAWMLPDYKDVRRLEKVIELKNWEGVYTTYLSATADSMIVWKDPFAPIVHKYIGPTTIKFDGVIHTGYSFHVYQYLCNDIDIVPTAFYSEYDSDMVLFYSKIPSVDKLNVPMGIEITSIEDAFNIDNWSYDFNPLVSMKRVKESDVPRYERRTLRRCISKINNLKFGYYR